MLLDQDDAFVGQFGLVVDFLGFLDEHALSSGGLEVFGEDSSAFGDDGGGFVVLKDLLFELFGFLGSGLIEGCDVSVVLSDFSLLLLLDASEDFSSWVEFSLEFGLKLDSLGVGFSDILIVGGDVVIAGFLE